MISLILDLGVWSVVNTGRLVKWMIWGSEKKEDKETMLMEEIKRLSEKVDNLSQEIENLNRESND